MNLKNYTSGVPADTSISRIKRCLVQMGAKNINEEYKDSMLIGVKFLIDIKGNTVVFELPANVDACYKALTKDIKKRQDGQYRANVDFDKWKKQAERTAWKIIDDWVQVQASMIYLEQAEVMQVFLPYALLPNGNTVYSLVKENGMKMLQAG